MACELCRKMVEHLEQTTFKALCARRDKLIEDNGKLRELVDRQTKLADDRWQEIKRLRAK